jgi:hypothetical protein
MKLKHVNKNAVYNNYLKTLTNKQKKRKNISMVGFSKNVTEKFFKNSNLIGLNHFIKVIYLLHIIKYKV